MLKVIKIGKELKPLKRGQKFGRLTIVGKDESRSKEKKKIYYYCQCSCGSPIKSIMKSTLLDKRHPVRSCGCIVKEKAGFIKDREIAVKKILYEKMKSRHIKELNDSLHTLIEFKKFCDLIEKDCFYCGKKKSSFKKDRNTEYILYYNGLDRVDSRYGYTEDNVVPACKTCNIAKGKMTSKEFEKYITRLYNNINYLVGNKNEES